MPIIKACVFDAFGTLFNLDIPTAKIDALTNGKGSELLKIWRNKQLEYTWLRGMMNKYVGFNQVTKEALRYAMEKIGTEETALFELLLPIYERPNSFPEVKECLQKLKDKGIITAILSNGTPEMLQAGVEKTGLQNHLDYILSVETVRVFKPSPKVYQLAIDTLKLDQSELLFFSFNTWDVAGAATFGLPTVWVNRKQGILEQLEVQPTHIIASLANIETVLT